MRASEARDEVEGALQILEKVARAGQAPSHYVARHVLLALGRALREGSSEADLARWAERVRAAGESAGEAWEDAIQAELTFACGEFTQCLDPRFLGLPNYDLEYTRAARARLEDRLRAMRWLGSELSSADAQVLELADAVLERFESRRQAGETSPEL
jgi:hypothetical protein